MPFTYLKQSIAFFEDSLNFLKVATTLRALLPYSVDIYQARHQCLKKVNIQKDIILMQHAYQKIETSEGLDMTLI